MKIFYVKDHFNFGDTWKVVSWLLDTSSGLKEELGLFYPHEAYKRMAVEILGVLSSSGRVILTDQKPTKSLPSDFRSPLVPTLERWKGLLSQRIVYQFDGIWGGSIKNPSVPEQEWFFDEMEQRDLEMVSLGKHLSVRDCVKEAARSRFFIGCDSGMAQLCYSVGIPTHVLNWPEPYSKWSWQFNHHDRAKSRPSSLHEFVKGLFQDKELQL